MYSTETMQKHQFDNATLLTLLNNKWNAGFEYVSSIETSDFIYLIFKRI